MGCPLFHTSIGASKSALALMQCTGLPDSWRYMSFMPEFVTTCHPVRQIEKMGQQHRKGDTQQHRDREGWHRRLAPICKSLHLWCLHLCRLPLSSGPVRYSLQLLQAASLPLPPARACPPPLLWQLQAAQGGPFATNA